MKKVAREFITSLITVIVAILAIALFIYSGATVLFYVAIAIALVFGFYNAWLIAMAEESIDSNRQPRKASRKRR